VCCDQMMKTYHTHCGDSQQAETKLKRAESQRVKSDQAGHTVIGRRFRRDYDKLSVKVWNSIHYVCSQLFYTCCSCHCYHAGSLTKSAAANIKQQSGVFLSVPSVFILRLCYDASVHLSVMEVHWRIIANLGFKFRSHFTTHCGRRAAGGRRAQWRHAARSPCCLRADHLTPC